MSSDEVAKVLVAHVTVSPDVLAHEVFRFALNEIVRLHDEDPYGTSEIMAQVAEGALAQAAEWEATDGT